MYLEKNFIFHIYLNNKSEKLAFTVITLWVNKFQSLIKEFFHFFLLKKEKINKMTDY